MTMPLCFAFAALSFLGCQNASSHIQPPFAGEFLVRESELPDRVVQIARVLERLSPDVTDSDFESVLAMAGMSAKSDWYKDFQHVWYFDSEFARVKPNEAAYHVTIGLWPVENSRIRIFDAGIHRRRASRIEPLWRIRYAQPPS